MTKRTVTLFTIFFLSTLSALQFTSASAQNMTESMEDKDQEFQEFCETANCRKNLSFSLVQEDGTTLEYSAALAMPPIGEGYVSVYPGETLYIEAEEGDTAPENLILVSENENPERTIVITFEQTKEIGDGTGMLLSVFNPFSQRLRYNLSMWLIKTDELHKTSSCPVIANGSVYEVWHQPIFQLLLFDMRFIEGGDTMICEE